MIFPIFLISSSYNFNLFQPIKPSSLRTPELFDAFNENLKIYNELIGAVRFLKDCGIDPTKQLQEITDFDRCPINSIPCIEKVLDNDYGFQPINGVIMNMMVECQGIYQCMEVCQGLISVHWRDCCDNRERYSHGNYNLREYLKIVLWKMDGKPQSSTPGYTPIWDFIIRKIETANVDEFWSQICDEGMRDQVSAYRIRQEVEKLEQLTEA